MNCPHYWILGLGKFGEIAMERLRVKIPGYNITAIDINAKATKKSDCKKIRGDAIDWIVNNWKNIDPEDYIIPALPDHVAYKLLEKKLFGRYRFVSKMPEKDIMVNFPNSIKGNFGRIYSSITSSICPDDCAEPSAYCKKSGEHRKYNLFEFIKKQCPKPYIPLVLISQQLAIGVGGFKSFELDSIKQKIENQHDRLFMLATACRCHGVIDFFYIMDGR